MDVFHADTRKEQRKDNTYYPFASRMEWDLASFLLRSKLSMVDIDTFLNLDLVSQLIIDCSVKTESLQVQNMKLSFHTAKELRSRAEILPSGPLWKSTPVQTKYPTKQPLKLYYRDPLDCLQALIINPLAQDHLHFEPLKLFKTAEQTIRVYNEWWTGDTAWQMQVKCCNSEFYLFLSHMMT